MLGRLPRYNRERTWHEICVKDAPRKKKKNKATQRAPLRIWSRWHRLGIHYECILSSLITLFVGLIAVLLKTGWAGGSFVPELMMSLCDRAGCEGWGHWNRLRGAAVRVLVWLAAAVIRPLCLQQGPTELPWQGPMFPTPPDSPDGPSDTEGEEGGRESVEIDRERGGKESQKRRRKWEKGEESIIRGERKNPGRKKIAQRNGGLFPESLLTALLLANTGRARWLGIRAGMFAQHLFFCSLAVTLKRAWVRNLIGGRHSWAQHNYKNPRSHTIAATHTHTHTHTYTLTPPITHRNQCLFALSGPLMTSDGARGVFLSLLVVCVCLITLALQHVGFLHSFTCVIQWVRARVTPFTSDHILLHTVIRNQQTCADKVKYRCLPEQLRGGNNITFYPNVFCWGKIISYELDSFILSILFRNITRLNSYEMTHWAKFFSYVGGVRKTGWVACAQSRLSIGLIMWFVLF